MTILRLIATAACLIGTATTHGAAPVATPLELAQHWSNFPAEPAAPHDVLYAARCDRVLADQGCTAIDVRRSKGQFFTLARVGIAQIVMGVDTGAHAIALDASWGRGLGVPLREVAADEGPRDFAGRPLARTWSANADFELSGLRLGVQPIIILDTPIPAGQWRPGLLGMELLRPHGAILDYARGRLWLSPHLSTAHGAALEKDWWISGYTTIKLRRGPNDKPVVPVVINGVRGWMIVDTGDPRTTLSLAACRRAGVAMKRNPALQKTDYYGSQHAVYEGILETFQLGAVAVPSHLARMVDYLDRMAADSPREWGEFFGLLGNAALISNAAVLDCGRDRLYLANRIKLNNFGRAPSESLTAPARAGSVR